MCKSICVVENCGRPVKARGWCNAHYKQQAKGQDISPVRIGVRGGSSEEDRFWSRVDSSDVKGCWLWTGNITTSGYGRMLRNRRYVGAHRLSYEMNNGPIEKGLVVDHTCHTPACVRPDHLQAVTTKQNNENRSGAASHSKTGVRGVHWDSAKCRYAARVRHMGRTHDAGRYKTIVEAEQAAIAKRNELFTNNLLDR